MTSIGVFKETQKGERRVALTPVVVKKLTGLGHDVFIEKSAGVVAGFSDNSFLDAGGVIKDNASDLCSQAQVLVSVSRPSSDFSSCLKEGRIFIHLSSEEGDFLKIQNSDFQVFSLERMPRISRAQSMDVLSSQSTVAGYGAVLFGAYESPRLFPMLMTAAGRNEAAHVCVLGAGVAGLQAIATAKRLGARVTGFDIRAEAKEQIESLGASFLAMPKPSFQSIEKSNPDGQIKQTQVEVEEKHLVDCLKTADVVITTAVAPGKKAPLLVSKSVLHAMKSGAVVVDLAAQFGGNCAVTQADKKVVCEGVTVLGPSNMPSQYPCDASRFYANNVLNFLNLLFSQNACHGGEYEDEILRETCLKVGANRKPSLKKKAS